MCKLFFKPERGAPAMPWPIQAVLPEAGYQMVRCAKGVDRFLSLAPESWEPLTASLIRFSSNCGLMKAAVTAAVQAGR
jgi:hypothetical protein